jgi:hypothetical protein
VLKSLLAGIVCLAVLAPAARAGQATTTPPPQTTAAAAAGPLRVFLDCDYCDESFMRTEITFIDYVRDRTDAELHVLVTSQETGGGGREFTLKFIGLGRFAGIEQTLTYVSIQTATEDERRKGIAERLKQGLVRYALDTPLGEKLKVTFDAGAAKSAQTQSGKDKWNLWVFRTSFGGSFDGEETSNSRSFRTSASANRTTEAWKVGFSANGSYRESSFELDEGEIFTTTQRNFSGDGMVVKSLTGQWSAAVLGNASVSTYLNYDLSARIAPGVEYDFFPYSESTRRLFTVQYTIGYDSFNYIEETIFGKLSEQLMDHRLQTSLSMRQPWGSAFGTVNFSQYLTQPDKYSISAFGETSVRLFKGFSFDVFGQIERTKDQLYLQRGEATTEEILVRQRQLATGYRYFMNFSVSYSFGSIFNNVVNPRFNRGFF